jgi:hypothetical protein
MRLRKILFVFLFSLTGAGLLLAQYSAGLIQGTVRDATGAVVPHAKISALMIATGTKFAAESNEAGLYVFPTLQPGKYQLTVEAPGMEKWEGELDLAATQEATLDPTLKVGGTATTVTVADVAPLVIDSSSTLSQVTERERIEQLPQNGRDITTIVQLTVPGLENGCCSSDRPTLYGQRAGNLNFTQDGSSLLDDNTERISYSPPGLDTVQEVSVETSVSSARYAAPLTADYSTRSGTNQWHGGAFYTGRNNGFGVARTRQQYTAAPQLIENEFGANFGGPVRLPHYNGKNRTFFFVAWEGMRLRQPTEVTGTVPTMAMRSGDFSGLTTGTGQAEILYDPLTTGPAPNYARIPFPNNQIPTTRESPFAKYVWSVTPQPTLNANPAETYNYALPSLNNTTQNTPTVRIDHHFSEKDSIFGRFSYSTYGLFRKYNSGSQVPTTDDTWNFENDTNRYYNPTISWNHSFSPTFFVETLGIVSSDLFGYCASCPADTADNLTRFGLPNPLGRTGTPVLSNAGYYAYAATGQRSENTKRTVLEQNYTKVIGKHQLRFGWHFQDENIFIVTDRPDALDINFGSGATSLYNPATGTTFGATTATGDNSANFFLGYAGYYSQPFSPGNTNMASRQASGYIQDDWKVRPDLTLNLGFRWDYFPMLLDRGGLDPAFDFVNGAIVRPASPAQMIANNQTTQGVINAYNAIGVKFETPQQAGWSGNMINVGQRNPDPRVGLAYAPRILGRKVVLRGGFGIFRENLPARDYQGARIGPPLEDTMYYNVNQAADTPDGLPNLYIRSDPTVVAGVNSANIIDPSVVSPVTPGITVSAIDRNMPTTLVREWNATMETEIMKNTMLRVSYIGNQGRNEDEWVYYNGQPTGYVWYVTTGLPLPTGTYANETGRDYNTTTYGDIRLWTKDGYSNYNGMTVQVERRFSHGLAFQWWYALSNALNTIGTPSETTTNTLSDPDVYLPGAVPTNRNAENRFLNYQRDTSLPKHRISANMVYQLPVGKGKRFLPNARGVVDGILGGWQMSATTTLQSRYWALPSGNFGFGKVQIYGMKYKIEDCRSTAANATVASCLPGYLYYNGYIPANQVNSYNSKGVPDGVMGVPSSYVPAEQPLNPVPATGCPAGNALCGTNDVYVPLNNGTQVLTGFGGLNPWRNQYVPGPWTVPTLNASLFKEFPIHERLFFRLQMDGFNVLNMPGLNNVTASTGIIDMSTSNNSARVLQWTARLRW